MDKKYQVFVSSTFTDLRDERQAAIKSILNMGHIPSGMELFPASGLDQLSYIKKAIDLCDYYLLVLGGRYGSLDKDGISFTEKEYDYAHKKGLPIIAMVHGNIDELKSKNVDKDIDQARRLEDFRKKVMDGRLCKLWTELSDLEAGVVIALTTAFSDTPMVGWRRDDEELSNEALKELNELSRQVEYYRTRYYENHKKLASYEELAETVLEIRFSRDGFPSHYVASGREIIREFAARLSRGLADTEIEKGLRTLIEHNEEHANGRIEIHASSVENVRLFFSVFEIADEDTGGWLSITDSKKYLLKAAFLPLKKVIDDNDIPF